MLTPRLQTIADSVLAGKPMADIGTDHGYIPVELVKRGTVPSAIAADINPGPLSKATALAERAGLTDRIATRLGSGIGVLVPGEAATIVIAGMGGYLIAEILDAHPDTALAAERLVLQPMNNSPYLRHYLEDNGFEIVKEELAREDQRVYEIIIARKGQMQITDAADYLIGYRARQQGHPLLKALIRRKMAMEQRILDHTAGQETENAAMQHAKSREVLTLLEEVYHDSSLT